MQNRFDFEQHLMSCWNVTEDINELYIQIMDYDLKDSDKICNVLVGLIALYNMKFERLFGMFEDGIDRKNI